MSQDSGAADVHSPPRVDHAAEIGFAITLVPVVLAVAKLMYFVPSEVVQSTNGQTRAVYVIESGDHHLTVIDLDGRRAEILRQDDVAGRVLCRAKAESAVSRWQSRPLAQAVFAGENPMPLCADVPPR
jgi:aspartate 1-decarboxylase